MLEAVLVVLLGLHLVLIDVALAGPLACIWLEWRDSRHSDHTSGRVGLSLARGSNWALTGGIVLGVVLVAARWWLNDGAFFSAVASVPRSRLWFALAELVFYFACMGAYVSLWNRWRNRRLAHRALAVAAATNLGMHFPALFAIISVVSTRADLLGHELDRAAYWQLLLDREVLSRVVHTWLAALAVTGSVVMGLALRVARDESLGDAARRIGRGGAVLGLVPTMLQIPAGLWLAMEMPEEARESLFGGDPVTSGLFAVSFVLTLVLLHSLAAIALGDDILGDGSRQVRRSIAAMIVLVILMAGTRRRIDDQLQVQPGKSLDVAAAPQR